MLLLLLLFLCLLHTSSLILPTTSIIRMSTALHSTPPTPTPSENTSGNPEIPLASINTVNARLQQQLSKSLDVNEGLTSTGSVRSKLSLRVKKTIDASRGPRKSDAEREKAIAYAQDLNGVDPYTTTLIGLATMASGYVLLQVTTGFLVPHFYNEWAVPDDAPYAFQRAAGAVRTTIVGCAALLTGFTGITGCGVTALGVRVGVGVARGELDPTLIKDRFKDNKKGAKLPDIIGLMTGKANKRGQDGDDPFGY